MAIAEGVQEQLHHHFMCFSSQHVPINFSDMGPTPARSEAKGYRDIDCEVLHTICILQGPVPPPSMRPLSGLSWARVLTLYTPPQWFTIKTSPSRQG